MKQNDEQNQHMSFKQFASPDVRAAKSEILMQKRMPPSAPGNAGMPIGKNQPGKDNQKQYYRMN
jgi:hypothetical protein